MVDRPVFLSQHLFHRGIFFVELKRVEKILWPTQPTATHPILANRKIETPIYVCNKVVLESLPFFSAANTEYLQVLYHESRISDFCPHSFEKLMDCKITNDTLWRIISGWLRIHIKHLETMAMAGPTPRGATYPPPKKRPYDQGLSTNGFPQ